MTALVRKAVCKELRKMAISFRRRARLLRRLAKGPVTEVVMIRVQRACEAESRAEELDERALGNEGKV